MHQLMCCLPSWPHLTGTVHWGCLLVLTWDRACIRTAGMKRSDRDRDGVNAFAGGLRCYLPVQHFGHFYLRCVVFEQKIESNFIWYVGLSREGFCTQVCWQRKLLAFLGMLSWHHGVGALVPWVWIKRRGGYLLVLLVVVRELETYQWK